MGSKKATEAHKAGHNTPNSEPLTPNVVHTPVLLRESVDLLTPRAGGVYVDGTLGAGGHATEILKRSAPDGILIGLDQDAEAVERCRTALAPFGSRAVARQANYRDLPDILSEFGYESVDGVLLDLGVSWFHLKSPERGFSFMLDGPLDMRMDQSKPRSAADLVNTLPREELARIIREYGEESRAWAIAGAIEKARVREPITSTAQLARIVTSVFPPYPPRRIHPATLTFQALRIAVNDELGGLERVLPQAVHLLKPGGRLAVISFHSLEDRIVKQYFRDEATDCLCPPHQPVCTCGHTASVTLVNRKPLVPDDAEIASNPRSRSAKLRIVARKQGG